MKKTYSYQALLPPMLVIMLLSTVTVLVGMWALQLFAKAGEPFQAYPAGIPWIDNEADCKNTGRDWQAGVCWDYEHNPVF
jgi:hypothetical protein